MTTTGDKGEPMWLSSTQAAYRYRVEATTFLRWQQLRDFPLQARRQLKAGSVAEWNVTLIDAWLRARPQHSRQRPARWWSVVGVEGYPDKRRRTTG
jgi:hypothetical protein